MIKSIYYINPNHKRLIISALLSWHFTVDKFDWVIQVLLYFAQERLECSKRGWELQHLKKVKVEEQERQVMEGDDELFTYTREDAYNMVGGRCSDLCLSNSSMWIF